MTQFWPLRCKHNFLSQESGKAFQISESVLRSFNLLPFSYSWLKCGYNKRHFRKENANVLMNTIYEELQSSLNLDGTQNIHCLSTTFLLMSKTNTYKVNCGQFVFFFFFSSAVFLLWLRHINDFLLNTFKLARTATLRSFNPELQLFQEINYMMKIQNKKEVLLNLDFPTPTTVPATQQAIKTFVD